MPMTPIHIKQYDCLLTQDGTTADPTQIVLHNTLSRTPITWTRTAEGNYNGTLTGAFPDETKVTVILGCKNAGSGYSAYWQDTNTIHITTIVTGAATDGILSKTPCEIKIYNNSITEIL